MTDNLTHSGDTAKSVKNNLETAQLAFIGVGVMAEAMIAGLLRKNLVKPEQITASHPRKNRREELSEKYGVRAVESNSAAVESVRENENSIVILCVKPQRLSKILDELKASFYRISLSFQLSQERKSKL